MKFKVSFSTNKGSLRYDPFFNDLEELGIHIDGDLIEFDDVEMIEKISTIAKESGVNIIVNRIE